MKRKLEEKFSEELVAANLKRVADWRGKFCLKASNQKSRKGHLAGKPLKLVSSIFAYLRCFGNIFDKTGDKQAAYLRFDI